ncbi:MAG: sigma-54-dependent Fis family transcriptional regulator [Rhodoferax sp.]|nr:sigma-54-dependent Fis family transcriptional regulator [Rhodoferax sp.]
MCTEHVRPATNHRAGTDPGADATGDFVELLHRAHERSLGYGLEICEAPDYTRQSPALILEALGNNRRLFQHAAPVMESLYSQIAGTHSVVLLTTAEGLILHSLGDPDFLEKASKVALVPGVNWSEQTKGTNAIGTALQEQRPVQIEGNQHFMRANHTLSCSCTPIVAPTGQVVGALDVTGDKSSFHPHTLALVRMSGQLIENQMFSDAFRDELSIHFHSRSEFLNTLVEGIAVFTPEGRFLAANSSAQIQLGITLAGLRSHSFSSLFGASIALLQDKFRHARGQPQQLHLFGRQPVWCVVKMRAHPQALWLDPAKPGLAPRRGPACEPDANHASSGAAEKRRPQLSSLEYLDTGDPQVSAIVRKLSMVRNHGIPIMILGETGTGKDLLAQAIHHDSDRSGHPFVSVNCASIPENLIESELFGYEEGAFTGARKKGSLGKIQQADQGTLFLDEVGDMPRHLQARLLRVLQERKVSPLGASKEVMVNVAVVCATNQNLKELISRGEFREDLYYRLNGLVVRLPALRDRTDFDVVVRKILNNVCAKGSAVVLSDEVAAVFRKYRWPGNFRQLYNLLLTASVMARDDGIIQMHHLPDDFLDEIPASDTRHPQPCPTPADSISVPDQGASLQDLNLVVMAQTLRLHKGNVSTTAKALGVSRNTIYRKKAFLPPDVWG